MAVLATPPRRPTWSCFPPIAPRACRKEPPMTGKVCLLKGRPRHIRRRRCGVQRRADTEYANSCSRTDLCAIERAASSASRRLRSALRTLQRKLLRCYWRINLWRRSRLPACRRAIASSLGMLSREGLGRAHRSQFRACSCRRASPQEPCHCLVAHQPSVRRSIAEPG
jgi:hypothetical protein